MFARQPEKPFGAQQFAVDPFPVDEAEKTLGMERSARTVNAGGNAVLFGFRYMLATHFLQPARRLGRFFEVEAAGVEDFLQGNLTHHHRNDGRLSVESLKYGDQFLALAATDQIDLAH
ncbi:hypothetical protein D3C85_1226850 [compost metagenome]